MHTLLLYVPLKLQYTRVHAENYFMPVTHVELHAIQVCRYPARYRCAKSFKNMH